MLKKCSYCLLILITLVLCLSCERDQRLFLGFTVGMSEQEYDTLMSEYVRQGVLVRSNTIIAGIDFDDHVYLFPSGQKGVLSPYFVKDSLCGIDVSIMGDKQRPIAAEDYGEIMNYLCDDYGHPIASGTDSVFDFEYARWHSDKDKESRTIVVYAAPDDDFYGLISMVFTNFRIEETYLLGNAGSTKGLSFVKNLKTCEEAEELAIHDYNRGRYRYVQYGLPSDATIDFVSLVKARYGIEVLFGGCVSYEAGICYSAKMISLLQPKLGTYFIRDLRNEIRNQ